MVNVPVRLVKEVFIETEYVTVPLPVPDLPDTILIQLALLATVQGHPVGEVTFTVAFPPKKAGDADLEDKE
jgi:hypothetical protein